MVTDLRAQQVWAPEQLALEATAQATARGGQLVWGLVLAVMVLVAKGLRQDLAVEVMGQAGLGLAVLPEPVVTPQVEVYQDMGLE